jgi:uncharacterized repeat protein (TIGR02543 family)
MQNVEILLKAFEDNKLPQFKHDKIDKNYALPVVDRSLTDRYRKKYYYSYRMPCALLKTSFGCPYQCSFCYCTRITNYEYYVRELEPVMQEIMDLKEDAVFIVDDNFLVDKERIKVFCELLEKHNIHKNFYYSARADYIANNEDVIELLMKHGFDTVFVGLESLPIPTKKGHKFVGWQRKGEFVTSISDEETGNVYLTAVWEKTSGCKKSSSEIMIATLSALSLVALLIRKKH